MPAIRYPTPVAIFGPISCGLLRSPRKPDPSNDHANNINTFNLSRAPSPPAPSESDSPHAAKHRQISRAMSQYAPHPKPLIPEFSSPSFSPQARFNPKSVTQAIDAARTAPPKPAHDGPLLHVDAKIPKRPELRNGRCPVSKRAITWIRYLSVFLRVLQLFGALGLLVCMLLMRHVENITGWICRVPVASSRALQSLILDGSTRTDG